MEKRLEDLEVRIAFQDSTIDALNIQQHFQQKEIDVLRDDVERLKQLLQQGTPSDNEIIDEPPPHY